LSWGHLVSIACSGTQLIRQNLSENAWCCALLSKSTKNPRNKQKSRKVKIEFTFNFLWTKLSRLLCWNLNEKWNFASFF
jgi:hypothetical protein